MKVTIEAEPKELVETLEYLNKSFFISNPLNTYVRKEGFSGQKKAAPEEGHAYGGTYKCVEGTPILGGGHATGEWELLATRKEEATLGMGELTIAVGIDSIAGGEGDGK